MSKVPHNLLYTNEHEWVKVEDGKAVFGITDHAQNLMGEIVFVELPEVDDEVTKGEEMGVVESVKTASDLFAPMSGTVIEVNNNLIQEIDGEDNEEFHPELVKESAYEKGWMVKVELSEPDEAKELLSPADYEKLLEDEA